MFENVPQWAIIFGIFCFTVSVPLSFLILYSYRIWKKQKLGNLFAFFMYFFLITGGIVIVHHLQGKPPEIMLDILKVGLIFGSSALIGSAAYFIWHGIFRKGKDK